MSRAKKVVIEILLSSGTGRNRLQGVFDFLRGRRDWDVRLPQTKDELERALAETVDGIITSRVYSPALLRRLEATETPVVFMDVDRKDRRRFRAVDVTVANDNGGIGLAAGDYFARLGKFRSFGFVPDDALLPWSVRRRDGYAAALRRHGHAVTSFAPGGDGSLADWIAALPKPAAVFCACDAVARRTLEACRAVRAKVPDRVAILGVDDDELVCKVARPELSSIRPDTVGEGFAAAKALCAAMDGKARPGRRTILLKHLGIVERTSTKPPPAAHLVSEALDFIKANAVAGATPDDVARHLGCSRRLLDLRFAQFHAESVRDALVRTRLEAVRRELAAGGRKFSQVAADCGFASAAALNNLFRKTYGLSLREFRKRRNSPANQ